MGAETKKQDSLPLGTGIRYITMKSSLCWIPHFLGARTENAEYAKALSALRATGEQNL